MTVRVLTHNDLAAIYAIQRKCPCTAQWRQDDYLSLAAEAGSLILVAEVAGAHLPELAGYAAFHQYGDEAELRNLAVDPAHQRKGIAHALLAEGFRRMWEFGVQRLFLEVRALNQPALALYNSLDFQLLYRRRNYYHDPPDDGLVMACDLAHSFEK
jgi:ribosomal-protein-alanine N-acetyltransferase